MRRWAYALAGAAVCVAATAVLAAEEPKEASTPPKGMVNAIAFLPMAEKAAIAVRPLDDSDANLKLKTAFEQALRARGNGVSADSNLILTFETKDEVGAWTDEGRRHVLELRAEGGREGGEYAHAKVNIYDSQSGGLLNQGRGGTAIATPSAYRIEVTLDDRSNGKRVWQGWTVAKLVHGDRTELSKAMAGALVQSLGRTVDQRTFDLAP